MNMIYKKVVIESILNDIKTGNLTGPVGNFVLICNKYNIMDLVTDSIMLGRYTSYECFKKYVRSIVHDRDLRKTQIQSKMYVTLQNITVFKESSYRCNGWFMFAMREHSYIKHCLLINKMLLNVYHMGRNVCKVCHLYESDSYAHALFICPALNGYRDIQYGLLRNNLNMNLFGDLWKMTVSTRCDFMLNMLNGPYIEEFHSNYKTIIIFIRNMYTQYYNKAKNLM